MISVELALDRILASLSPLGSEIVGVADAQGRVLAENVNARRTQPPVAVSSMDGYAVRAADIAATPASLNVVGYAQAGSRREGVLSAGEAVRIFTGAPIPEGADAIVLQEDVERTGDAILVTDTPAPGRWMRNAGMDFEQGVTGLNQGQCLTPRHIGLAAAMNIPWLPVYRRPRVAILATGDELAFPGEPLNSSQIVSSNGFTLAALIHSAGGSATQLGIARDNASSLKRFAAMAEGYDLLVTIGGASVGDHDLIRSALGDDGLTIDFWKIAMRPGKPLMYGSLRGKPVIGLPGNPVSSFVCALLFLVPALEKMQGLSPKGLATRATETASDLPANDERQDYLRANLVTSPLGAEQVQVFSKQDSSMLSILAKADCLVVRPPLAAAVKRGTPVPVILLQESRSARM